MPSKIVALESTLSEIMLSVEKKIKKMMKAV
jgi:hypothetical protein